MNRSSIFLLLLTGLVIFCTTGFTHKPLTHSPKPAPRPHVSFLRMAPIPHPQSSAQPNTNLGQLYYWYTVPYDFYNDRKTLPDEIYELWALYDVLIDQDPSGGGYLLMKGYYNNAYPHNQLPQVLLYGHFPWSYQNQDSQ